ncbi:MAG: hypothetical protein HN742_26430 [Lentisphaerae bacterium]|jgi:hypothetical protein|nr:hypothetical protein [Lentisphaerota bacterium]MBT4818836.1 hypothetical protein [Lentisphaerota bacterium]MBT5606000.1 hypothetical protein [Lentisphaerota bacterium]MBT7058611.1 hypothetical protein [Lentisphaerota bacterium]MBT7845439.1 hypothetical protein [Lentisphaerota bacterium]
MSRRRGESTSRDDIRETVDRTEEDLDSRGTELEVLKVDVETVRNAVERINWGGTSDAVEIMESAVDGAEQAVIDTHGRQTAELDEVQAENAEHGDELGERSDVDREDADHISDTAGGVSTQESVNELTRARDAVLQDIDFLLEQIDRAQTAGERSQELQDIVDQAVGASGRNVR